MKKKLFQSWPFVSNKDFYLFFQDKNISGFLRELRSLHAKASSSTQKRRGALKHPLLVRNVISGQNYFLQPQPEDVAFFCSDPSFFG